MAPNPLSAITVASASSSTAGNGSNGLSSGILAVLLVIVVVFTFMVAYFVTAKWLIPYLKRSKQRKEQEKMLRRTDTLSLMTHEAIPGNYPVSPNPIGPMSPFSPDSYGNGGSTAYPMSRNHSGNGYFAGGVGGSTLGVAAAGYGISRAPTPVCDHPSTCDGVVCRSAREGSVSHRLSGVPHLPDLSSGAEAESRVEEPPPAYTQVPL